MTQKIATSKEGINVVGTAGTVPNNLNYSSDYNTLKYYSSGTINLTLSAGTPTVAEGTVAHNLGYYPFFQVYVKDDFFTPARYYPLGFRGVGEGFYLYLSAYVGTANLVVRADRSNLDSNETWTFFYKIFRNNLGL